MKQVEENILVFRFYNLLLSVIIVFGVVYNNARLSFSERARELAAALVDGLEEVPVVRGLTGPVAVEVLPDGLRVAMADRPRHDYDGEAGFCDQPVRRYGRPLKPTWIKPTHWMPLPEPPQ